MDFKFKINGDKFKILQLTDTQIMDTTQMRHSGLLDPERAELFAPENMDKNCFEHIRSLVAQTNPDLILITGDLVYGQFDDNGSCFKALVNLMESFCIPWAPVFGNHDNESKMGVYWQCEQLENAKNCIFKRGNVTGFGNYTIGIYNGEELVRIIYMLDSHGCLHGFNEEVRLETTLYDDQIKFLQNNAKENAGVKSFLVCHIPSDEFRIVQDAKGYPSDKFYRIGVDVEAKDGDFGSKFENFIVYKIDDFFGLIKEINADGVFVGHNHQINTSILYNGVRYTFGLKSSVYDFYRKGHLGGTLITLEKGTNEFTVNHIPSLV